MGKNQDALCKHKSMSTNNLKEGHIIMPTNRGKEIKLFLRFLCNDFVDMQTVKS